MAKVIETVMRFKKVEEATAQRDEPAPVYVLDELAEISKASPENAQGLVEHVVKRLSHKSPVVKFKALRLIKHLCSKGCTQFQRYMQRHSQSIRELTNFKGDPDPFKGDAPNQHVREMAKETVESLFNTTVAAPAPAAAPMQGRIQGFGSSTASGPGPSSMSSISSSSMQGGKMVGFGNPRMEQHAPPPQPTVSGMLNNIMKGAVSAASSMSRPTSQQQTRMYDSPPRDSGPTTQWQPPSFTPTTASQVMGSEDQLVDDLCAPGGLRAAPPQEDLQRFVDAVGNMDGLRIGELLREKMESSNWQTVLRALYAVEAVVNHGSSQACGEVAIMFQSEPTPIRQAARSPQTAVVEAAARVLKLLLDEDIEVQKAAVPRKQVAKSYLTHNRQQQQQPAAQQRDLLALDDSMPVTPTTAAPVPDLLDGLDMSPTTASTAPTSHNNLLSGFNVTPSPAAPSDMFGGLNVSSPTHTAAHAPAVAYSQNQRPPLEDFISLQAASPPRHPQQTSPQVHAAAPGQRSEPLDMLFSDLSTSDPAPAAPMPYQQTYPQTYQQPTHTADFLGASHPPLPAMGTSTYSAPPNPSIAGVSGYGAPMVAPSQQPYAGGMDSLLGDVMGSSPLQAQQQQQQAGVGYPAAGMGYGQGMQTAGISSIPATGSPGMMPPTYQQQQYPQQYPPQHATAGYGAYGAVPAGAGVPSNPMPGGYNAAAAAAALGNQFAGAIRPAQHPARPPNWKGNDEVSNLMRHVATGGKHDPAFDFIKDELKPQR